MEKETQIELHCRRVYNLSRESNALQLSEWFGDLCVQPVADLNQCNIANSSELAGEHEGYHTLKPKHDE